MEKRLTADLNVVANSNLEIQLLDGDLNIIQKLDDEPNDVGGLTSAELKEKFDESGNIIKKYVNERYDRNIEGIAETNEACCLAASVYIEYTCVSSTPAHSFNMDEEERARLEDRLRETE